jgi:hypothetical protein
LVARSPNINCAPSSEKLKNLTKPALTLEKIVATNPTLVINTPKTTCNNIPILTNLQSISFLFEEKILAK